MTAAPGVVGRKYERARTQAWVDYWAAYCAAAPGVVGRTHKHRWVGVGGCAENPGVWQIHATHPTRGGTGIALVYHHRCEGCEGCGMHRESTSYQMTDGSWVRGRPKMTSQEEYEGADE